MLPTLLARQLQQGMEGYIRTTFPMTNAPFDTSLSSLFDGDAVYHRPFISVKLPFRKADAMPTCFSGVTLPFLPYVHQALAYERLVEGGRSTLIATGTGSGKTECFLNPVLEYCYQHRGEPGIKALVIYPMNALATDQATRFAAAIYDSPALHDAHLTVGMYVGGGHHGTTVMTRPDKTKGALGIITDHETLLASPPDILLTNYKMLDYLLVRPHDAQLWRDNARSTLKFIVVDEFHTFDGAQGTDLACLLRRLKFRLGTPRRYLSCVGTSATMGGGTDSAALRSYATAIFDEPFDDDAVITEDRLTPEEFFAGAGRIDGALPSADDVRALEALAAGADATAYLERAAACFFPAADFHFGGDDAAARLALGEALRSHAFFQDVLTRMGGRFSQVQELAEALRPAYPVIADWQPAAAGFDALFSLVAYARSGTAAHLAPFLFVQVELWMRELRRLVGRVDAQDVRYMLAPDLNEAQKDAYLPVVNCRECGATGWAALIDAHQHANVPSLESFYNVYFSPDVAQKVVFLYPGFDGQANDNLRPAKLCPTCHALVFDTDATVCPEDRTPYIDVVAPRLQATGTRRHQQVVCPFCGSHRGVSLMGLRAATEISASLSQLMASRFNDDKKALAFSDSVQDAAHRAGFFNARTWRSALRGAIQHYVDHGGAGETLEDFLAGFLAYWENELAPETFVSMFCPPNLVWDEAYRELLKTRAWHGTTERARHLWLSIECRLAYEILLEYGVTSRIGRTLEKAGCSCLAFDRADIEALAARVQARIAAELGVLADGAAETVACVRQMVLGWLLVMKENGAFAVQGGVFDDGGRVMEKFAQENLGKKKFSPFWLMPGRKHWWLPGLQRGRNTPRLLFASDGPAEEKCPSAFDTAEGRRYVAWIEGCLETQQDLALLSEERLPAEISRVIFEEAEKIGLVVPLVSSPGARVCGLSLARVRVTADVHHFRCGTCGKQRSVAAALADLLSGAACDRRGCAGRLLPAPEAGLTYFGRLYRAGDIVRIHATEHTGLLARADRENVENNFKRRAADDRREWDPNVLSCTPTLEMGIDIGDLSSVILCSMPPGQAQFQQRVGRAGRSDGNALVLVVANARPHDLYFYADPLDMMQGAPRAPQIFLSASAVLERQFFAFCFDNWVAEQGKADDLIPRTLASIFPALKRKDVDHFPLNFEHFLRRQMRSYLSMFFGLFEQDEIDAQTKEELSSFAKGAGLAKAPVVLRLFDAFEEVQDELASLRENARLVKQRIRELEAQPKDRSLDDDIYELRMEKRALLGVMKAIKKKDTFNFLSDEGLLPNYAFPEEGITLKAVLFRRKDEDAATADDAKPSARASFENHVYEYQRAASSALSEFAPGSSFYAGGHQFTIDQVDVHSADVEPWRLCPNCAHAEREASVTNRAACPVCGDPRWADVGQVRKMLKVRMVYSNMDIAKSLIDDGSDNRDVRFYTKQLLVDVDEDKDIIAAFSMNNEDFAFGYEFARKASLREINFGEADALKTTKMMVNGVEEARKGFRVCLDCGRLADEDGKIHHTKYCKTERKGALALADTTDCIFLYREFQTEVLRVLIPETTAASARVKTESFAAAFLLGLREQFGNAPHLRAAICDVPVKDAGYRKQYLVIYDSVPGGTGYLKQIMQSSDVFVAILEKALAVLETCSCKDDPQKDGCYHCLYAYRQSTSIGNISRRTAMQLLRQILSGKQNIEAIDRIGDLPTNSLFDSELEQDFIAALPKLGTEQRHIEVRQDVVNDKKGYRLTITTGEEAAARTAVWEIEPQVILDGAQGVAVRSKPDFLLRPVTDAAAHRPVAVFTDGYQFHKAKMADDTLKRAAIVRSGNFRVWSLSYQDVQVVLDRTMTRDFADPLLDARRMPVGRDAYDRLRSDVRGVGTPLAVEKMGAMELLVTYLARPDAEAAFSAQAKAIALALTDFVHRPQQTKAQFAAWNRTMQRVLEQAEGLFEPLAFAQALFGTWLPSEAMQSGLTVLAGLPIAAFHPPFDVWPSVCVLLDDSDFARTGLQRAWNGLWQFANVLQFAPSFLAVTQTGLAHEVYLELRAPEPEPVAMASAEESDAAASDEATGGDADGGWAPVLAAFAPVCAEEEAERSFLQALCRTGLPTPDTSFAEVDAAGIAGEMVELGWTARRIAFILHDCDETQASFREAGWTVFDEQTALDAITKLFD